MTMEIVEVDMLVGDRGLLGLWRVLLVGLRIGGVFGEY